MRLSLSLIVAAFACAAVAIPVTSSDESNHLHRRASSSGSSSEGDTRLTIYYASSMAKSRVEAYAVTAINGHLAQLGLPHKPVTSGEMVFHTSTSGSVTATATHVSFELWNAPECGEAPNHHCTVSADIEGGELKNVKITSGAGKTL